MHKGRSTVPRSYRVYRLIGRVLRGRKGTAIMVSMRARILLAQFWLTRRKRVFTDLGELHRTIRASQTPERAKPPGWLTDTFSVSRTDVGGWPCYTIRPERVTSEHHVLYLHGGAYVHEIEPEHWVFLARLTEYAQCAVTAVIYPLAPLHVHPEALRVTRAAYDELLGDLDREHRILMGDSAGGGLVLATAQRLAAAGESQPKEIIMISPWLDLTMTDPELPELDDRDPFLGIRGLVESARLYALDNDLRDPELSPLFGKLTGLGHLSVFIGTRDILLADAHNLLRRAQEQRVPLNFREYEGMFHTWMLDSMPEAKRATAELADLVRRPSTAVPTDVDHG